MTVRCDQCGKEAPTMAHVFYEGRRESPAATWTIEAPLYFKAAPGGRTAEANFCGPACATAFFLKLDGR